MAQSEFEGRRFVVTGAASGMGAQLVTDLRARGGIVTGLDIREPTVELDRFVSVDMADAAAIRDAADAIGDLDDLVHCAGIPEDVAPPEVVMSVNFFGLRELTQALLPRLADGGNVLSIASVAGHRWRDREDFHRALLATDSFDAGLEVFRSAPAEIHARPVYATSKEAVWAYTAVLATKLLSRGIRVNSVCPGPVNTRILPNFMAKMSDASLDTFHQTVSRPLDPAEITSVMMFLLSGAASQVTGQNVIVDGGFIGGATFGSWEC